MALEIKGEYYLNVTINGYELPLNPSSLLDCLLIENNLQALPSFTLSFQDQTNLATMGDILSDGAVMTVQIGKDRDKYEIPARRFRIMGQPLHVSSAGGMVYKVESVLDAPKWLHTMPTKPFRGTSTAALKQMAADCGLKFSGDNSSDTQTWYPARRSYAKWAYAVAQNGWFDAKGCTIIGVGLDGVLQYRNLGTHPFGAVKAQFNVDLDSKAPNAAFHVIKEYKVASNSNLTNHTSGYPVAQHSMNLDGTFSEPKTVTTKRLSKTSVSKEMSDTIGATRTMYAPPSGGNTHANYQTAAYQNKRLRSMWSTDVYVMVDTQTALTLFDPCELLLPSYGVENYSRYSGRYIASARTIFIRGNRYGEKIEFTNMGPKTGQDLK